MTNVNGKFELTPVITAPRARPVRVPYVVEVTASSEHNFWTGFTQNLSEGGLFFATPREIAIGSIVALELRLPSSGKAWNVQGEVRWTRRGDAAGPDSPPGLGVRFVNLDPELEREIRMFVAQNRETYFFDEG